MNRFQNLEILQETGEDAVQKASKVMGRTAAEANLNPENRYFFVKDENRLLAVARIAEESGVASLRGVEVLASERGKGIGSHLVSAILKEASQPLYCLCFAELEGFYTSAGFAKANEHELPTLLKERIQGYRSRNPNKSFIAVAF